MSDKTGDNENAAQQPASVPPAPDPNAHAPEIGYDESFGGLYNPATRFNKHPTFNQFGDQNASPWLDRVSFYFSIFFFTPFYLCVFYIVIFRH